MISDAELAKLLVEAYEYDHVPFAWDFKLPTDDVRGGVKHLPDCDVVVFPGTENIHEWILNFDAVPKFSFHHPTLGIVHTGFWVGLEDAAKQLDVHLRPGMPLAVVGHSRGAAHAALYSAICHTAPDALCIIGSPRPGGALLARHLHSRKIKRMSSYLNKGHGGHDLVTEVPFTLYPLAPYCPVMSYTNINVEPQPGDSWGLLAWHRAELYLKGISDLAAKLAKS